MNILRNALRWLQRNWSWLKWPIALAVLAALFYYNRESIERLRDRQIRWGFLAAAFVLCAASIVVTFLRWFLLVWAQDFDFTVSDALRLGFLGYLFNFVGPGVAGGDFVKAVMIAKQQKSRRAVAAATVLLDRILGMLALFMVGAIVTLFKTPLIEQPEFRFVTITFWAGTLAGLIGLAVLLHPATPRSRWLNVFCRLPYVGKPIEEIIHGIVLYQTKRMILVLSVLVSVFGHLGILSTFYLCGLALHPASAIPNYITHLQLVPAAELAGVVVPLPGGIGALEQVVDTFYQMAGSAKGDGFMTTIAYRVVTVALAAVGGIYYLNSRREIEQALEESDASGDAPDVKN